MCMMGMMGIVIPSVSLKDDEQMCSAETLVGDIMSTVRQKCAAQGAKGVIDVYIEPRLVEMADWAGASAGKTFSELIDPNDENGWSDETGIPLRPEALSADKLLAMARVNYWIREAAGSCAKDDLTSAALQLSDDAWLEDGARRRGAVAIPVGMISGRYLGCPHRGEVGMLIYVSVCTDAIEDQDEQAAWSAVDVVKEAFRCRNDVVLIRCLYE